MKKREEKCKKEWHKPAYGSLKLSQTLGGSMQQGFESETAGQGKHRGAMS